MKRKSNYPMANLPRQSGAGHHGGHHPQHRTDIKVPSDCSRSGSEEQILHDAQTAKE